MEWTMTGAVDFLTEAEDVDVYGAVGDGAVPAPDGVEQLLAAEDDAGAAQLRCAGAALAFPGDGWSGADDLRRSPIRL
jgi:hypothetical protein